MDPRIARTRGSLRDALVTLAQERDVDEISVADIAERAQINRSTFYQHYTDKGVLLADVLDAVTQDAMSAVSVHQTSADLHQMLVTYLEHVSQNLALYRRIFSDVVSSGVQARMRERLEVLLMARMHPGQEVIGGLPFSIAAASITGSAVAIIATWVQSTDPVPPGEAAGWVWQMVDLHGALPDQ